VKMESVVSSLKRELEITFNRIDLAKAELKNVDLNATDEGDQSGIAEQRLQAEATLKRLTKRKIDLEHALERSKSPLFGNCEDCDAEIPEKRLLAFPSTTCCVACQSVREARQRHYAA